MAFETSKRDVMANTDMESLAFDYFMKLSRVEYALKKAGFVTGKEKDGYNARPDWTAFKNDVHERMNLSLDDSDIKHLMDQRPARHLFKDGALTWSEPQKIGKGDKRALIDCCLTIRNNLFHGDKYGDGNKGRNEILLKAAAKILDSAINANDNVKYEYEQASFD